MSIINFTFDKSIYLPDLNLWLDSRKIKDFGFVSHAHGDHIARHKQILCSQPTADFLRIRLKNPYYKALEYGDVLELNEHKISLHPAGHILGSSQIRIENSEGSFLYTGDFRIKPAKTAERFEFVKADVLIMESTFGLPHYKMPPRQEVENELVNLCEDLLKQGKTPAVFGYSLGKGQEAAKILAEAGLPLAVDYMISRYIPIYKKYGIEFPPLEKLRRSETEGKVLLLPSGIQKTRRFLKKIDNVYTIFLSGWGIDKSAVYRYGVDKVLPFSDHADFDELLELAQAVKPQEIYCTHGFDKFVNILRSEGFRAYPLEKDVQMALDI